MNLLELSISEFEQKAGNWAGVALNTLGDVGGGVVTGATIGFEFGGPYGAVGGADFARYRSEHGTGAASTPRLDRQSAQLHQRLSVTFEVRKLR